MTTTQTAGPTIAPRHTWVPYVGAAAGAALLLKAVLIIGSGNDVGEGPMAVLYLGGLLLGVVAAVGAGLRRHGVAAGSASRWPAWSCSSCGSWAWATR